MTPQMYVHRTPTRLPRNWSPRSRQIIAVIVAMAGSSERLTAELTFTASMRLNNDVLANNLYRR